MRVGGPEWTMDGECSNRYLWKGLDNSKSLVLQKTETEPAADIITNMQPEQNLKKFHSVGLFTMLGKEKWKSKEKNFVEIEMKDNLPVMSLSQAVRDGILAVVQIYMDKEPGMAMELDTNGISCLHYAVRYNRIPILEAMLEKDVDVNIQGVEGFSLLHGACKFKSVGSLNALLKAGADTDLRDTKGKTALHVAARRGSEKLVKILLEHGSNVNACDVDSITPLHDGCLQKNENVIKILVDHGANIEARDTSDKTGLMMAAGEGHTDAVRLLLDEARRKEIVVSSYTNLKDDEGETALHSAVENGMDEIVQILLSTKADVDARKVNGSTPLHIASINDFTAISSLLIERGADVRAVDDELMTPLHRASIYGRVGVMQLLLDKGAKINAKNECSLTPLLCASRKGRKESVDFLLSYGAHITSLDDEGRTCLHLAVESQSIETMYTVLTAITSRVDSGLLESRDRREQTAMHYASSSGQLNMVSSLLNHLASTDAKDMEEKTPLHLAAENGRESCVEELLTWGRSEINDDDMDGNTPLLLACRNGHLNCTNLLLSFGADLSSRDENHYNAIMLASKNGHTSTVQTLLCNNSAVNATDKNKNTALHHACYHGHTDIVQLLLDANAIVTHKNIHGESSLDRAINNMMSDAAVAMMNHSSWKQTMSVRDSNGFTPMKNLIKNVPDAAQIVLNKCVQVNDGASEMVFNFEYVDPPPNDPCCKKAKYLAMCTMVEYKRESLLSHPLSQTVLAHKWQKFGRVSFSFNVISYLIFMLCCSGYSLLMLPFKTQLIDDVNGCSIVLNDTELQNSTLTNYYKEMGQPQPEFTLEGDTVIYVLDIFLICHVCLNFTLKVAGMAARGAGALFDVYNWLAIVQMACTLAFVLPPSNPPCLLRWRFGWIALFLAWINVIMYLRRLDHIGIYVIMFTTVLKSLFKAAALWILFVIAFASALSVILSDKSSFELGANVLWTTFSMSIGEVNFVDNFINTASTNNLSEDAYIISVFFVFVMPVALMNLLIGIAVGDIEKVTSSAYLSRIEMQVDLLYHTEKTMPKRVQQWFYILKKHVAINQPADTLWGKLMMCARSNPDHKQVDFIDPGEKDRSSEQLEKIQHQVSLQDNRMKSMQSMLEKQSHILKDLHDKLIPATTIGSRPATRGMTRLSVVKPLK